MQQAFEIGFVLGYPPSNALANHIDDVVGVYLQPQHLNECAPDAHAGRPIWVVEIDNTNMLAYVYSMRRCYCVPMAGSIPDADHAIGHAEKLAWGYYHRWLRGRV